MKSFYVNFEALNLLCQCVLNSHDNNIFCFGVHFGYLHHFGLIDDETVPTHFGKMFAKFYISQDYYNDYERSES